MNRKEAKIRIEKLKKAINKYRYAYHVLNKSLISDEALDSLKHELYKLEQQYPEFITPDSPTQRVAGKPLKGFKKVKHFIPMISLEDVFSEEELFEWEKRIQKLIANKKLEYFTELKIDGFAISLIYEKGIFKVGSTRGDGKIGEDVTQNLKTIESIPLKLEIHKQYLYQKLNKKILKNLEKILKDGKIEVRGEVYMTKRAFDEVNKEQKRKGLPTYSNPRNLAAGSVRQLDPKITASRKLDFLAYDLITNLGQTFHSEEHEICHILGFKTDKFARICKNLNEVIDFWREAQKKREELAHLIDGVVVNINNNNLFEKLGVVGKAPRGAIAFKFPPKESTTIVKDIIVQVGRTGVLTPVAVLKPVKVGGVIITRATLHNEDEIKRLELKIGDTVIVQRAGDVIPEVVKVLKNLRTGKEKEFKMPKRCPVCKEKIVKKEGEVAYRCINKDCPARKRENLYHFVSKKAFDIKGLGPKIIDRLVEEGFIFDPSDIFKLKKEDIYQVERFAEKSAQNLITAINKSRSISLEKFIYALGIPQVGEETAIDLANYFGSLEKLSKSKIEDLKRIEDIGDVVAKSIFNWFNDKYNQNLIKKLKKYISIKNPKIKIKQPLKNKKFVLTGKLENFTREEVKKKIRSLGGDISSSISRNIDYVLSGKDPGSKYQKAKKLGIKIILEKEFLDMIK